MPDDIDIEYEYEKAKAQAAAGGAAPTVAAAPPPTRKRLLPSGELAPDDGAAHFGYQQGDDQPFLPNIPKDFDPYRDTRPLSEKMSTDEQIRFAREWAEDPAVREILPNLTDENMPKTRGEARRIKEAGARAEFARHARVPHLARDYATAYADPETQRHIEEQNEKFRKRDVAAHEARVEELPYKRAAFLKGVGVPLKWVGVTPETRQLIEEGEAKHPVSSFLSEAAGVALPYTAALKGAKLLKVADWLAPTVAGAVTGAEQEAAQGGNLKQILGGAAEGGSTVAGFEVAGAGLKALRAGRAMERAIGAVNEQRAVLSEARGASRDLEAALAPGRVPLKPDRAALRESDALGAEKDLDAYLREQRNAPADFSALPKMVEEAAAGKVPEPMTPKQAAPESSLLRGETPPPQVERRSSPRTEAVGAVQKAEQDASFQARRDLGVGPFQTGLDAEQLRYIDDAKLKAREKALKANPQAAEPVPEPADYSTLPDAIEDARGKAEYRQAAGLAPEGHEGVTSIKNRIVNKERVERGLGEMAAPLRETHGEWVDKALGEYAANPNRGYEVANELISANRPHTKIEAAILDIHRVNLRKARAAADAEGIAAADSGNPDAAAAAKMRSDAREADLAQADMASGLSGSEWGRSGSARQIEMAQDYSLAAIERKVRKQNGYRPLTEAERVEVRALYDKVAKAEGERDVLAAKLKEAEAKANIESLSKKPTTTSTGKDYGSKNTLVTREAYEKALAAFKGTTLGVNPMLDPAKWAAAAKVAGFHIEAGARSFAAWAAKVKEDLGDEIEPHLKALWAAAHREVAGKVVEDVAGKIKAAVEAGKPINPADAGKLAEMFLRQGVEGEKAITDAVHGVLKEIDPSITRSQARDAISGYGKQKKLDADPVKVELRELKGQMLQLAKLEDMAKGKVPLKSGPERQAPQDAQRELIRLVNEAKKKGGYDVTDPATELRTALQATKTRLRNEISDLDRQIAAGQKDIPNKTKLELDAEATALKARRDELKAAFDEAFEKPGLTDQQKVDAAVKAAEKSIAEYERRVKTGDVFPAKPPEGPTSPQLEALRKRRDELRQTVVDMRDAVIPRKSGVEAEMRAVEKSIAEYERRLKAGDVFGKKTGPKSEDPRVTALKSKRDELRQQVEDLRAAATPRLSDYEIQLKSLKSRNQKRLAELEKQIKTGELIEKRERQKVVKDKEVIDVEAKIATAKEAVDRMVFEKKMANRSRAQKAADTALQTAQTARAIMTSFDLSAPLRQGLFYVAARPFKSRGAFAEMFSAMRSPQAQARVEAAIRMDPDFASAKQSGVFFNQHGGTSITKMEEEFMSRWAENIPGVAGSQRAYTTFLNKARLDYFKTLTAYLKNGEAATPKEMRAIASFVNVATGRGGPTKAGAGFLAGANHILFSPRLLMSRLQILSGAPLVQGAFASKRVAKIIAKEYARFLGGVGTMYGAALAAKKAGVDIDVTFDPRSADFGKLRFGHTRLDPLGGLAQVVRLGANTITGEEKKADGRVVDLMAAKKKTPYDDDLGDVWGKFLRTKLAPIPGAAWSAATKRDVIGNRTNWGRELSGLVIPLSLGGKDLLSTATRDAPPKMEFVTGSDVYQAMKEHGWAAGSAMWILSLFGMGLQHYDNAKKGRR